MGRRARVAGKARGAAAAGGCARPLRPWAAAGRSAAAGRPAHRPTGAGRDRRGDSCRRSGREESWAQAGAMLTGGVVVGKV